MRWALTSLALAASAVLAGPVVARPQAATPAPRPAPTRSAVIAAADAVARRYAIAGEVLVARGDTVLLHRGYGTIRPDGGTPHRAGARWRLASITKQVTAALVLRATNGDLARLDQPIALTAADRGGFGALTVRQLLTHHSGLANPEATAPNAAGVPAFYARAAPDLGYCLSGQPKPGAPFSYNNCDYVLFGAGYPLPAWPRGMAMARPDEVGIPGFVLGRPEPAVQLASYGAAGGLMGTVRAVFDFDRALMTGKLLPAAARDALWTPEGNGSYQALGQWVFPGRLAGCAAPKRIVQRDGEILGVQARNFILPDDDLVVIVFTNRSSDDFSIGEVWQGKGFAFDLLSAVACP